MEIIVKPGDKVPDCTLLKNTFGGVRLPKTVRVYDTRQANNAPVVKRITNNGIALGLWGSERAAFTEGIDSTSPQSCTTYTDARTCQQSELARQMKSIRQSIAKMLVEYRRAKRNLAKSGDGGSCVYKPVFVAISNYGWSIHADRNNYLVASFRQ
jgi:hypothetical protein